MRITGGEYGGRKLTSPKGKDIRPTSDRMRLAIFNMLDARLDFEGLSAADMFCGTGALGIEALSRGAAFVYFFDKDRRSHALTQENLTVLGIDKARYAARQISALTIGARPEGAAKLDLILIDPPYRQDLIAPCITALVQGGWLADDAYFVIESEKGGQNHLTATLSLEELRFKNYGESDLGLYRIAL